MRLVICACFGLLAGTSLLGQLQFLNPNSDWSSQPAVMVTDGAGNMYVVSNSETDPYGYSFGITATKRDSSNGVVYSFSFAAQLDAAPLAAAVDSQGSLFIGGWTDSAKFPQVNPVLHPSWAPFVNGRIPLQGFLVKIDPAGSKLLFSTLVGGNDTSVPYAVHETGYSTSVTALALDHAGNVYAVGGTRSPTFPVSSGAFQKTGGGLSDPTQTDNSDVRTSGFLIKISSAGGAVLYSTYLGGQARTCAFPQSAECAATVVSAVAVDDQLRATVAGLTVQPDFPVTPGAFQTGCHCDYGHSSLFVSRFHADGSALEWSTFLGSDGYPADDIFGPAFSVVGLVLNGQGDATVAGVTYSSTFPVTSGAIQAAYPVGPGGNGVVTGPAGFLAVIDSDGSSLLHSTYFGGTQSSYLRGLVQDSAGNLWITGEANSGDLPKPRNSPNVGSDYVAEVDASLTHVLQFFGVPNGSAGKTVSLLAKQDVVVTGASNAVVTFSQGGPQVPSVWGVAGSAEPVVSMRIAPGELVSIYGAHLGPDPAAGARLDASGKITTDLDGYQVLVNGIAAPLLYAGANQINFVVPFAASNYPGAAIQVMTPAGLSGSVTGLLIVPARPEIFSVLVNQDGTINSQAHPAPRGSIVTFWASGGGAMDRGMVDGAIGGPPLGKLSLPVQVSLGHSSPHDFGEVTYAGAAPGMVAGVIQINFQVPAAHAGYGSCHLSCPVTLVIGNSASLLPDPLLWVPD